MAKEESRQQMVTVPPDQVASLQDDDYKRVYANSTKISATPWDIQLTFGQTIGVDKKAPITLESVTVILSPPQAKALGEILRKIIDDYETQFGPIPSPEAALSAKK